MYCGILYTVLQVCTVFMLYLYCIYTVFSGRLFVQASCVCNSSLWLIAIKLNIHHVLRASPKILENIHAFIEASRLIEALYALCLTLQYLQHCTPANGCGYNLVVGVFIWVLFSCNFEGISCQPKLYTVSAVHPPAGASTSLTSRINGTTTQHTHTLRVGWKLKMCVCVCVYLLNCT